MHSKIKLLTTRHVLQLLTALAIFAFDHTTGYAQQNISGKIVSANDQSPLYGVTVHLSNSKRGVTTANDGSFSISAEVGSILNFSLVGYLSKSIKVASSNVGTISLEANLRSLDSVVIVGYGTQRKVNLTGAITTVDMADKDGQPITNVSNALHGAPGLFVNLGNSQPGVDRADIRIRGIGTLNNNDPLVLVDELNTPWMN